MTYELYSFENKIPNKKILQMIDILTSFYGKKDENYDSWIDMIKNTKDYFILLGYNNNKLIGFINYMYKGKDLIISEVQIVSDYQNQIDELDEKLFYLLIKFFNYNIFKQGGKFKNEKIIIKNNDGYSRYWCCDDSIKRLGWR